MNPNKAARLLFYAITFAGFGQTVATTGSSANPYKFAGSWGYRDDGDAGLFHVGARYYDAQVGRFITRDTELEEHPYLYCEHDPVNAVDPSGHYALALVLGGGALGVAGPMAAVGAVVIGGVLVWNWWQSKRPLPPYGGSGPARPKDSPRIPRETPPMPYDAPHKPFEVPPWWGKTPSPNDPLQLKIIWALMQLWTRNVKPNPNLHLPEH